jgi:hypothetical protein
VPKLRTKLQFSVLNHCLESKKVLELVISTHLMRVSKDKPAARFLQETRPISLDRGVSKCNTRQGKTEEL